MDVSNTSSVQVQMKLLTKNVRAQIGMQGPQTQVVEIIEKSMSDIIPMTKKQKFPLAEQHTYSQHFQGLE